MKTDQNGTVHKPLMELTTKVGSGSTPKGGEKAYPRSGVPFIRSMNVRMCRFTWEGIAFIHEATHKAMRSTQVRPNDVLLNITGASIGRVACAPPDLKDANVNQHVAIIRPIAALDPRYLMYWLAQPTTQNLIMNQQKGFSRQGYTKAQIQALVVPVPPMNEQCRIVARIEELATRIEKARGIHRKATDELASYLPAYVTEVFDRGSSKGWEWRILGDPDVCSLNPKKSELNGLADDLEVSFVPMSAVDGVSGTIRRPEQRNLGLVRKGYTYFAEGDVVFAKITPCMENGKSAIAHKLTSGIGFGTTEFHVLRPGPKVIAEWLHAFVRRPGFREAARNAMYGAAGQQRVPLQFLAESKLPVPSSLDEQRRITARIEELAVRVQELQTVQEEIDAELESFMPALLAKAFRGEL